VLAWHQADWIALKIEKQGFLRVTFW
jgi:hypothetical protein